MLTTTQTHPLHLLNKGVGTCHVLVNLTAELTAMPTITSEQQRTEIALCKLIEALE